MTYILEALRRGYGSIRYSVLSLSLVFLGYITELELAFFSVLMATVVLGLLICRELRFLVTPLLSAVFIIPLKGEVSFDPIFARYLSNLAVRRYLILLAVVLVLSLLFFVWKNRRHANPFWTDKILLSMLAFCGLILLNGAFGENVTVKNFAFALLLLLSMPLVYAFFAAFLHFDETLGDYVIACFVGCGLLVGAELLFTCFTNMQIVEGKIVKESMILGWGSWTNVGNLLLMTMPSCFYCAVRHRWGFVGYWLGVLHLFFIVLCQSRGALLCGIVPFLACVIYACTQGNNRKKNRAYTVCLLIGLGTVLFGMGELARGLIQNFLDFGFFDNGRFLRWELSWNAFLQNPLFGAGFYSTCNAVGDGYAGLPALSHNTLLQILGSCGIVGMAAYAFHRYTTVKMIISRRDPLAFFVGMAILGFLLFGLLDVPMFTVYPNFYYALMLLIAKQCRCH